MLITIDYREKELIEIIQLKLTETQPETEEVKGKKKDKGIEQIKLNVENLKLGDIVISHDDDDGANELLIFERKSLNDLASSIKDGRYAEQSFRLDGYESVPNHNIVYIIEGDLSKWKENAKYGCKSRVNKKTLLSSMCSMLYYKGFSVIRTMNMTETCELILNWADKLEREKGTKNSYYSFNGSGSSGGAIIMEKQESQELESQELESQELESQELEQAQPALVRESHYCNVFKIKKEKNGNITPGNIGEIMLCTIPGISSKTAIVIMKEFKTINGLIKSLEKDAHCLNNIYMETNGKKRKISSQCIENIRNYLLGDV